MDRRDFLTLAGAAAATGPLVGRQMQMPAPMTPAASGAKEISGTVFNLEIAPVTVELAPNRIVSTIGYNGMSPGPLLRMKEGVPVTVNVVNRTDTPEYVHFHGLLIPSEVDGSEEEGTPPVPPHGSRSYQFTPAPAGTRWYHTHAMSMDDLHRGTYTGQFGFLVVEGGDNPGNYDREHYLALRDWEPYFTSQYGYRRSRPHGAEAGEARGAGYAAARARGGGRSVFDQRQSAGGGRTDPGTGGRARHVPFSERERDRDSASGARRA